MHFGTPPTTTQIPSRCSRRKRSRLDAHALGPRSTRDLRWTAKRPRYSVGVTPRCWVKMRQMVLTSPSPVRALISLMERSVSSSSRRASSTRTRRTSSAGDSSRCGRNQRLSARGLTPAPSASRSTGRGSSRCSRNERVHVVALGRGSLLPAKCGAELRLISGPSQEQDQLLRDRHRDRVSVVFLHEREGKVDARRDACRSPEAAIVNEDALVDDRSCWKSQA